VSIFNSLIATIIASRVLQLQLLVSAIVLVVLLCPPNLRHRLPAFYVLLARRGS
jgi:hypothetical protein